MTDSTSFEPKRKVDIGDKLGEPSLDHQAADKYVELMKQELDENMPKKHGRASWLLNSATDHILQVYYHTGKLQTAVKALELLEETSDVSRHELQYQESLVKEYAADVGNHAMMVLDVLKLLGVPVPEPKSAPTSYSSCS